MWFRLLIPTLVMLLDGSVAVFQLSVFCRIDNKVKLTLVSCEFLSAFIQTACLSADLMTKPKMKQTDHFSSASLYPPFASLPLLARF